MVGVAVVVLFSFYGLFEIIVQNITQNKEHPPKQHPTEPSLLHHKSFREQMAPAFSTKPQPDLDQDLYFKLGQKHLPLSGAIA